MEKEGRDGIQEKGMIQQKDCGEGDDNLWWHQVRWNDEEQQCL